MTTESNNGWFPFDTAPRVKGKDGKPHRFLVTHAPAVGMMPIDVVWRRGGKTLVTVGGVLRYVPTHWRPMLDPPAVLDYNIDSQQEQ